MGLLFKDIITKEFEEALKKLCDFFKDDPDIRLKMARIKKKSIEEKEVYYELLNELAERYREKHKILDTEQEKFEINNEFVKKQMELKKCASEFDSKIDYSLIEKTNINANDLHALMPLLVNVKPEEPKVEAK